MNFYERVKELCEIHSLTIPQMCEKAGISFSIIYDIKSGRKHDVSRKTAEKIATAFEITVSELYKEKTPDAKAPRAEVAEAYKLFNDLSAEKQQEALNYLRFLSNNQ